MEISKNRRIITQRAIPHRRFGLVYHQTAKRAEFFARFLP